MADNGKIEGTVEAWESGLLGTNPEHVKVAPPEVSKAIDDALGMPAISIRLDKELINDFKMIAKHHGMGYQPLMREALKRFAESEWKRIAILLENKVEAMEKEMQEAVAASEDAHQKKAA